MLATVTKFLIVFINFLLQMMELFAPFYHLCIFA